MSLKPKALISVSNKRGVDVLARFFVEHGWEILSTGGTAKYLGEKGISYTQVSDYTGFPEMLDGRLKTLQPKIHGGILARRDLPEHHAACLRHAIAPIDWVIVNLYPFAETIRKPHCTLDEAIENIDIGGPTLLRAAAKNYKDVVVGVDPDDYEPLIAEFREHGKIREAMRFSLARKVFEHTAAYNALIQSYFSEQERRDLIDREFQIFALERRQGLRYGENPHQRAALFAPVNRETPWVQLQGKELSYNNLLDLTAAHELACEFPGEFACVIVKHTNPCGVGRSEKSLVEAFECAKACDPVSAFGGIVAVTSELDTVTAKALEEMFLEVVVAPAFSAAAKEILEKKKGLRLIQIKITSVQDKQPEIKRVLGGYLIQESDTLLKSVAEWQWVSSHAPSAAQKKALELAWKVAKHVKSNAIVLSNEHGTLGIGAGQMSRVDSVRIAGEKAHIAGLSLKGAVLASDAFFPFRDNIDEAAKLGIAAIVEPGGSVRDPEVIAACNERGIALAFTGERHFKH